MSLTQLVTRAQLGIDAPEVRVEVHISNGLPAFTVVGLPETAVREARDRVRSAVLNSGFEFPPRRITVNLAPADLPKTGGRFDLPIALGILAASGQIDVSRLEGVACFGELALGGDCSKVDGMLPALIACQQAGQSVIIPHENAMEASLLGSLPIRLAHSLAEVCNSLNGGDDLQFSVPGIPDRSTFADLDLADVYGQALARRALEIAACGGHHMLMMGPPGTGKSMLAQRLISILPEMSDLEALESASLRSICGLAVNSQNWLRRPFQSPHHTVSGIALVGGGRHPRPGEISLAHNGVLFLDELTEFDRRTIEVLREPLESGRIHISRAAGHAEFPARFQLITAMNPCPGGCDSIASCECSAEQLNRYRHKLSAPLLDRIDIQIELGRLQLHQLLTAKTNKAESSASVRKRVIAARQLQMERQGCLNSQLDNRGLQHVCDLPIEVETRLANAIDKLRLSARSYHKILKLARSIADLSHQQEIDTAHLTEAISFRRQDRRRG